jgi:hypothetical protein
MQDERLGSVVAQRALTLTDEDGQDRCVVVLIGQPVQNVSESWTCPFVIEGLGDDNLREIYGADSMQALVFAIMTIATVLESYQLKSNTLNLTWLGDQDLGFEFA